MLAILVSDDTSHSAGAHESPRVTLSVLPSVVLRAHLPPKSEWSHRRYRYPFFTLSATTICPVRLFSVLSIFSESWAAEYGG